ncbi:hypothetical protein [Cystobacter fuscus]|uniref:hypothetical protein n=1 Tax=Cystobacter fuscus TaxID=43 RepID=UPI0037C0B5C2
MEIVQWKPKQELSEQRQRIIERMTRSGKLFAFLRRHRHEFFDEAIQQELQELAPSKNWQELAPKGVRRFVGLGRESLSYRPGPP